MPGIALEIRRKCKVCGKVFIAKTLDSQFCCKRCGDVFRKRQLDAKKREETLSRIILQIRDTIYRLIRKGRIPAINLGTRLTRIKREDLEKLIPTRDAIKAEKAKPIPRLYNLEPENCYTVGEICKKYHINDSSVWAHVRKYSIPSRQIGNFVYIPKEEIDNLYKSDIK